MWEAFFGLGGLYLLHRTNWVNLDFPIRQRIRWRRRGLTLPAEPKYDLFGSNTSMEASRLVMTYHQQDWARESGRRDFLASLFYLQMLERAWKEAGVTLPEAVTALDGGPSDWFYVQSLLGLLRHYQSGAPRTVRLDGVEVDAFRVHKNFFSRYDWAEAYIGEEDGARYLPLDLREYREPVDVAFLLFPFLFPGDTRRWGLPRKLLQPRAVLAHIKDLLKPGGWLTIANQGASERTEQHRLLAKAGLSVAWWGRHDSPFMNYRPERYVTVVARP